MDFRIGPDVDDLRAEVSAFMDDFLTPERVEGYYRSGVSHDPAFTQELIDRGWFAAGWPEEDGGPGRDPLEVNVFLEELMRHDAPTYANGVSLQVAKAILYGGSEELRR